MTLLRKTLLRKTLLRQAALLAPLALACAGLAAGPAAAQAPAKPAAAAPAAKDAAKPAGKDAGKDKSVVPGFGSNSKEPIQIDADKLEVFSKEQRAVYTGNVVAVQGETTIKAPTMIVFYERQDKSTDAKAAAKPAGGEAKPEGEGEGGGTQLKRVEAKGGVSVVSKDQVATGNEGVFDRAGNKIILTGNVALSQGENVTKGQKLIYDTETGIAVVESGAVAGTPGGRVRGVFVPGSSDEKGDKGKAKGEAGKGDAKADPKAKPAKPQG